MNDTLRRFGYPDSCVKEYLHWVVLVRPGQVTFGCTIIAAKSPTSSLGDLTPDEAAELPRVLRDFEQTVRRIAPVSKFNYLALMMVDPNPHFHAIPRHATVVDRGGVTFADVAFPNPPDVRSGPGLTREQLEFVRRLLQESWLSEALLAPSPQAALPP
jgi:diadenosine tetraphosphate (Ap4A) HIT family hydrolase